MIEKYFIGGSPCSGKSTITELLAKKYDLYYFKVDDFLEAYMTKAASQNKPVSLKVSQLTPEQIWMRDPVDQNLEEFEIYKEIFEFIIEDIKKIQGVTGIIAEGAALLPELMNNIGIDAAHYVSITPTKDFQVFHYKQREWVPYILEGCSNKEKAFENWMDRDALFAKEVRRQCEEIGYTSLVTDGTRDIQAALESVALDFKLDTI